MSQFFVSLGMGTEEEERALGTAMDRANRALYQILQLTSRIAELEKRIEQMSLSAQAAHNRTC